MGVCVDGDAVRMLFHMHVLEAVIVVAVTGEPMPAQELGDNLVEFPLRVVVPALGELAQLQREVALELGKPDLLGRRVRQRENEAFEFI